MDIDLKIENSSIEIRHKAPFDDGEVDWEWCDIIARVLRYAFAGSDIALSVAYPRVKRIYDSLKEEEISYYRRSVRFGFKYILNCAVELLDELAKDPDFLVGSIRIIKITNYNDLSDETFKKNTTDDVYAFDGNGNLVNKWPKDVEMINIDGDSSIICWYGIDEQLVRKKYQNIYNELVWCGHSVKEIS